MAWKILSFVFIVIVIVLLVVYWFVPFQNIEFIGFSEPNNNFTLYGETNMQFYENMRYPSSEISYRIYDCPLMKKNNMERAFEILEKKTILNFYDVLSEEEISITCDSKNKFQEGLFIAGEGGPTNITKTDLFNVILKGKVLLIRDSNCPEPNVAIHELLHALGFAHSENKNNIMYHITNCDQEIGQDTIDLLNEIYSVENLPDLNFVNITAVMNGKYLNTNISVKNNGLKISEKSTILIYSGEKLVHEFDLEKIDIGHGRKIYLENIWVSKISTGKLKFIIDANFPELNKENNQVILKIKEK